MKRLLAVAACVGAAVTSANAQVLNTDYYDFEGRGFIETQNLPAACTADGLAFGDQFTVVYRFDAGTNVVYDAIAFVNEHADYRVSAVNPPYSLAGANVAVVWDTINSRGTLSTGNPSTTSLYISPAGTSTITNATLYVAINGTFNNFENIAGCTLVIRAALARRPN